MKILKVSHILNKLLYLHFCFFIYTLKNERLVYVITAAVGVPEGHIC